MAGKKAGSTSHKKTASVPIKKRGKVYKYVKTKQGIFPFSVLKEAEIKKPRSKQIIEESKWISEHGLIPHPFNYSGMLDLQENSTYFDATVRQIAKDVIGAGWDIVAKKEGEDVNEEEKAKILKLLGATNSEGDTFDEVIERVTQDWGTVGLMAIEASRDSGDEVDGLFHVPSHTLYMHKDKNKAAQKVSDKIRWFKKFGYEPEVDIKTGKEGESIQEGKEASELILHRNYYNKSTYYGAPNGLSAVGAITGMISVKSYNLAFFDNYGIPAALVTLIGDWEENSAKQISDFIDTEIKRTGNAHKTMIMELPEGGECKWEPLSVDVKEGSFSLWTKDLRDEVLAAYRMPPYRIGIAETGSLGGSTASEATIIYNQSVIMPLKNTLNRLITETIIMQGLKIENSAFKFKPMDTRDLIALVGMWTKLFGIAVINVNYIRAEINLERVDHGDDYFILNQYVPVDQASFDQEVKALSKEEIEERVTAQIEDGIRSGKIRPGKAKR